MTLDHKNTTASDVDEYNKDTLQALTMSLHLGSLQRPRTTLVDLAGLAANDNEKKGE